MPSMPMPVTAPQERGSMRVSGGPAADRETARRRASFPWVAIAIAVLFHVLLGWFLLQQKMAQEHPPMARIIAVTLTMPRPPPPVASPRTSIPKPAAHIEPAPVPAPKPVQTPRPIEARHAAPASPPRPPPPTVPVETAKQAPPPTHFESASAESGLGLGLDAPAGSANGHGAIGDFDDAVKQRIQAAKSYPPGLKHMPNECVVSYRVSVDHGGNLLDYKIDACGNPFLDAAARAAILKAAPFPVPPDFGGNRYDVYGSLIFRH